jgi:isopenicillin N synthase-like dioxygenase
MAAKELLPEADFGRHIEEYYQAILKLCWVVLDLITASLPYRPHVFDEFKGNDPVYPLRLLQYPPTPALDVANYHQLGNSAHTEFGAITLLLQDDYAGLKVQDRETGEWIRVPLISDT